MNNGYEPREYVRITVRLSPTKTRAVWAREIKKPGRIRFFRVYSRDGEQQQEMIAATQNDILAERPARISLKYGLMELGHYTQP